MDSTRTQLAISVCFVRPTASHATSTRPTALLVDSLSTEYRFTYKTESVWLIAPMDFTKTKQIVNVQPATPPVLPAMMQQQITVSAAPTQLPAIPLPSTIFTSAILYAVQPVPLDSLSATHTPTSAKCAAVIALDATAFQQTVPNKTAVPQTNSSTTPLTPASSSAPTVPSPTFSPSSAKAVLHNANSVSAALLQNVLNASR